MLSQLCKTREWCVMYVYMYMFGHWYWIMNILRQVVDFDLFYSKDSWGFAIRSVDLKFNNYNNNNEITDGRLKVWQNKIIICGFHRKWLSWGWLIFRRSHGSLCERNAFSSLHVICAWFQAHGLEFMW